MVLGTTVCSAFPYFQATVANNQLTPLRAKSYQQPYYPKRAAEHFLTKNSKFEISREILCGCQRLWSALHQTVFVKQKKKTKSSAFIPRADVRDFAHVTQLKMKQSKSKSSLELPHHHPSFLPSLIVIIIIIVLIIFILIIIIIIILIIFIPDYRRSYLRRRIVKLWHRLSNITKGSLSKNHLVVRNLGRDIGAFLLYWLYTKHSKY